MENIEIISKEVEKLLDSDNSGHGMDHVKRVSDIAVNIAEENNVNIDLVIALSLLHDVDDYKLFGDDYADNLINTKNILSKTSFNNEDKELIINGIKSIGYSKRLEGITPDTMEAKIVSDADMLDSMGAIGLIRSVQYNLKHHNPFFDREVFPILDMDADTYRKKMNGTVVNHLFEKILKLKDLMLTKEGKKEAERRYQFLVDFLKEYFYEEKASEWLGYLNEYTRKK